MKDLLKNKYSGLLLVIPLGLFLLWQVINNYDDQKEVSIYGKKIIGEVVKFDYGSRGFCSIDYSYSVDGKKYRGSVGVTKFDCEDGTKCCIGKKFYVYYSSKNPEYSRIYLGKYEKYKTSVEFFK
ncbi:hypothetical protein [Wenyingzhuangia sp. IMCC45574]